MKKKIIRITTVPMSLDKLIEGQMAFMSKQGYEVVGVSSPNRLLLKVGEKEDIRVKGINMTRKISPLKDIFSLVKLITFLKKEKPLIVHTHTPKAGLLGMMAAKLTNVPIRLHTVAGMPLLETTGIKKKILVFTEKLTYYCATYIYPNSYGLKAIISKKKYSKPEKVKVLGSGSSNGINTTYFNTKVVSGIKELKKKLNINKDDIVFVFVGRLVKDKGINELVKSFNSLSLKYNNIKLLLVGPYEKELDPLNNDTIESIKSNNKIMSVGYQNDVRPYFSCSDVLVFPSYREGFPNVVMQAGAMGLPCIVSNINGCNEIIENNTNGLIIPSKDTNALYEAMEKVLLDKTLRLSLHKNARNLIVSRYEQSKMWQAILDEYKLREKNV